MKADLCKILFPEGIKCIVCDDELPAFSETGLCIRCNLPLNQPFCAHCGRGFFRPIDSKSALADYLKGFSWRFRRAAKREYAKALKLSLESDCEKPQNSASSPVALCKKCQMDKTDYTAAAAPFLYLDNVRLLVHKLKFSNGVYLAEYMAKMMVETLNQKSWKINLVAYAPLSPKRLKKRGYNQAQRIAEHIGRLTGLKVADILDKVKENKPLSQLTRAQRMAHIANSVRVVEGLTLNGQNVLLIDDVFTTGATVNECAKQLKRAGANLVYVLTFATGRTSII